MSAVILDGKKLAQSIKAQLAVKVAELTKAGKQPGLGTVLVGDDPGSHAYVTGKHKDCHEVGIKSIRVDLPANVSEGQILDEIKKFCSKNNCPYIIQGKENVSYFGSEKFIQEKNQIKV